ncbi:MAG: hypothetical protein IKC03_09735, partial [Oscillospiraceae bacterium]|nr:hypothetical protein [Oscillospiraceae bacterium]
QTGDMGDFDGVGKHILAVAGAVLLAAQQLDKLGIEAMDVGVSRNPTFLCTKLFPQIFVYWQIPLLSAIWWKIHARMTSLSAHPICCI